jgi:DNA polymerase I
MMIIKGMLLIAQKKKLGEENKMNEIKKIVEGKNDLKKVVNVEINDNVATLFLEEAGVVSTQEVSNKFWLVTNKKEGHKLQGNLHYQYGLQFNEKRDWQNYTQRAKKTNQDFFTIWDAKESFLTHKGYTYFKGMKHTEPSILSFDIESTGLFHNADSKVLLISNTFRSRGEIIRKLFAYDDYSSAGDMLQDWCAWIQTINPSIICGHNIYTFDLPYIQFVADKEGIELNLGRDGSALNISNSVSKFRIDGSRDQEYHKCRIYGRDIIDTMFLAIKHDVAAKKYESYGLKSIIKAEGLEKVDRQHYDSSQIRFKYKDPIEWAKIKDYCIHDSDDGLAVYDLCSPATFYLTQSVPKTFQQMVESATGSQINAMMVRSYIQDGHSLPKTSPTKDFTGAISFGNPGIYRNVHKIDVASLYPSIVLECQVYDEDKDPNKNFLKIMQQFTTERLKNKQLAKETGDAYYEGLQQAQKIVINSGYGFMGAQGLMFNSPEAADFITRTGRDILNLAIEWAASKTFKIPNADTDSISYCRSDGLEISSEEQQANLIDINRLLPHKIRFEDDGYFPTVVILKTKNYVLFDGKKIKIKGSALKASGKPPAMKEMIKKVIDSIVEGKDNYLELYNNYIKEAAKITDIKRWASRKTISEKTLTSERTNETRIKDTLEGTEYVEGDKIYTFFKTKDQLELAERFDGTYDLDKLLGTCYDTIWVFENVIDCNQFVNYKLKKSKVLLQDLINA